MKSTHPYTTISATLFAGLAVAGCDGSDMPRTPSSDALSAGATSTATALYGDEAQSLLTQALAEPNAYRRAERLGAALSRVGDDALPLVQATLRHFPVRLGPSDFDLLIRFWADRDAEQALAWVARQGPPLHRPTAIRTAIEIWASQDPSAAMVALQDPAVLAKNETARAAQVAFVHGWYRLDRVGLEQYIYGLGSGIHRQRALFAYIMALASDEGSEAAIAWAEAIPTDDERYKLAVYRQTLSGLVWIDSQAATRFCDTHCDGEYGQGLRNVLIRARLLADDPGNEVVEWVGRLSVSDEEQIARKNHSLWVAYSTWARRDQAEALAWMREQTERDEADWLPALYGEYARQLAVAAPAEAMPWAERIEDDSEREQTLIRIARSWLSRDSEAAEAWLASSPLSEASRNRARDLSKPTYLPGTPEVDPAG